MTTLYVTHDQIEAMTMGDRVAVLKPVGPRGESNLQQIDTPQALYDRPRNLFVAGFIGSPAMSFVRARLAAAGSGPTAEIVGTGVVFDVPPEALVSRPGLARHVGREVILGVRPEALVPCGSEAAILAADILITEALGADSFVFFDLPTQPIAAGDPLLTEVDGSAVITTRIAARIPPDRVPRRGERLHLAIDRSKLHWFDPATGAAL